MKFLFSVGILFQLCFCDVKCRNDDGEEVDWLVKIFCFIFTHFQFFSLNDPISAAVCPVRFILYKLPNENDAGLLYLYMDESTNGWKLSNKKINSRTGSLGNTLKPLLDFYNKKVTYQPMINDGDVWYEK